MQWKRIDESRYWDMLGALPPAVQTGLGFLLGEAWTFKNCSVSGKPSCDAFRAFAEIGDEYFEAADR